MYLIKWPVGVFLNQSEACVVENLKSCKQNVRNPLNNLITGTCKIIICSFAVGEVTEDAQQTSLGGGDRERKKSEQRLCL